MENRNQDSKSLQWTTANSHQVDIHSTDTDFDELIWMCSMSFFTSIQWSKHRVHLNEYILIGFRGVTLTSFVFSPVV